MTGLDDDSLFPPAGKNTKPQADACGFVLGKGRAAYPASQIPFRECREPFRPQRPMYYIRIYILLFAGTVVNRILLGVRSLSGF